jgi:hypothetical protein
MQNDKEQELRERAEADLEFFIRLVHPDRVLGHVHRELIQWWNRSDAKTHQLTLLPRDHQKSAMLAYRVAWEITRNPAVRVLYISATTKLAVKQLSFIKGILTSDIYRHYWPDMVNESLNDRTKWTETEISVDHHKRRKENIRDATVDTAGLTTVITGLHFDIICIDDVVIDDNAKTREGREEVKERVSYLASIAGTDSSIWVVGTRYHPDDLYSFFLEANYALIEEDGFLSETKYLYEIFERQVEDRGDGTGNFIWPRMQRSDGKWFGFDQLILAKKKAQYSSLGKFRAQYYNSPSSDEGAVVKSEMFQYYDKKFLYSNHGVWYFKDKRLNVQAAMDFAYSKRKEADYTAIVVAGIDSSNNVYVLDIERFKTDSISEYFDKLLKMYSKWNFRKIRLEVVAAQSALVKELKESYIRPNGLALAIDEHNPSKKMSKEERIEAVLNDKYTNQRMWHYKGGNCELLEDELTSARPKHDDIKDALASCLETLTAPSFSSGMKRDKQNAMGNVIFHSRFGGVA